MLKIASKTTVAEDGSRKYLIELEDHRLVESVFLPDPRFYGVCVSTQVGCNMGCKFCATGQQRVERNLTVDEIVGQAALVHDDQSTPLAFDFVTLAGMGEPLANYASSVRALELLQEKYPSITVVSLSTIGFPDKLQRLVTERRNFRVYLSLHATNDEERSRLIPMAEHYKIAELVDGLSDYGNLRGKDKARISYLLLRGVNDSDENLSKLISLAKDRPIMVQLLFFNTVAGASFVRTDDSVGERWLAALGAAGIDAYKMPSMGRSIGAACGQLATKSELRLVKQA